MLGDKMREFLKTYRGGMFASGERMEELNELIKYAKIGMAFEAKDKDSHNFYDVCYTENGKHYLRVVYGIQGVVDWHEEQIKE